MKAVTENWRTTIIGLVVIGLGVYLGISGAIEWTNLWAFVAAGLGLLIAKDGEN